MICEKDMFYVERSKKLNELVESGLSKSDACRVLGMKPGSSFDAYYVYMNHIDLYNSNYVYKKIVDSKDVSIRKGVATKIAENVRRYYPNEKILLRHLKKGRSITRLMDIGKYTYEILTTIYKKELTDMD